MFILIKKYYSLMQSNGGLKINCNPKKSGFKFLLVAFLVFAAMAGNATIYYVSSVGNDSNSGTSSDKPWKSLSKVNSFTFKPGDQILFRSGDEWTGSITVSASGTAGSPIIYGAYGTGTKPKIIGSEVITGWTRHSGNIYKATFNKDVSQLFVNNKRVRVARYPNNGYFFINSVQNSTQFTSNELDGGINYTGAKWFGRSKYWLTELKTVTSSSSKTLTLDSAPSYDLDVDEGFFLMNKLEFLDQAGEWYYDTSSKTVYLWTPNGDSPENYVIRGSVHDFGIYASRKDYITIQGLDITQHRKDGIYSPNCNYLTVKNNIISFQEENGIRNNSSSNHNIISNNVIRGMNGNGIYFWATNDILIEDNEIYDVALWENIGNSGTFKNNMGNGMEISGDRNIIRYNRIIGMGYNGIFWRGATLIEYNFIQKFCLIKDDGGGIYTNTQGSHATVRYNIVLDAVGMAYGFTAGRALAEGIYIDESAVGVKVEHNTVARSSNSGIKLHKNDNALVRYNTIMGARQSIHILRASGSTKSNINNNIMYATSATDDYLPRQVFINRSSANAICDNNTYINPYADSGIFRDQDYYCFDEWKSKSGQDKNSRFVGTKMASGEKEQLIYNDTKQAKTFNLGNKVYRDVYSKQVTGSITLQPFTSMILIETKNESVVENQSPVIMDQSIELMAPKAINDYLGQVVASDPDTDQVLSYTILDGNEEGLFTLNSSSGKLYAQTEIPSSLDKSVVLLVEVKDNATNPLSANANVTVNIKSSDVNPTVDTTPPVISSFSIPSTSNSLLISVTEFTASDDVAVTGWVLTESSVSPSAGDAGWLSAAPKEYTFAEPGTKTLFAWTKDAAGNVSNSKSGSVVITLPEEADPLVEYVEICEGEEYLGWTESGKYERILSEETIIEAEGENLISNNDFSNGTNGWSVWGASGSSMTMTANNSDFVSSPASLQIDCISSGTHNSDLQLINKGNITLEAGKEYQFSFYAKASVEFALGRLIIHKGVSPWTNYGTFDVSKPVISTSWKLYNLKFTATESATDGSFRVYLGNSLPEGQTVYFDDFVLSESSEEVIQSEQVLVTYLTVNPIQFTTEEVAINEGENYLGWTESGQYERVLEAATGCDSIVTTNLTVMQVETEPEIIPEPEPDTEPEIVPEPELHYLTEFVTICEGEDYNGWTTSGVYEWLKSSETESDTLVTTYLTVESTIYLTETIKIEEGEDYYGFTEPGHYERILESSLGCDSVVTTKLIVKTSGKTKNNGFGVKFDKYSFNPDDSSDSSWDIVKENDFLLYPNPAQTHINIEYTFHPERDTRIEIIDGNGRTVLSHKVEDISSRIDFDQLPPGLYYLRSVDMQTQQVKKFIIQ